jgi:hypothetical protein
MKDDDEVVRNIIRGIILLVVVFIFAGVVLKKDKESYDDCLHSNLNKNATAKQINKECQ